MRDLTILLPAYNEEGAIGRVLDEIKESGFSCEVIVINNGSTDGTASVASSKGAKVLEVVEKGKGNAIREGIKAVRTPYIIMVNSDYTYCMGDAKVVYGELIKGYDVVVGFRYYREPGSMPLINLIGNWGLSLLASVLYGRRIHDVCSGMWGFRKDIIDKFDLRSEGFTLEADFFTNLVKNGCSLAQVPIAYRRRIGDSKGKLKVLIGLKIALFLLGRRI